MQLAGVTYVHLRMLYVNCSVQNSGTWTNKKKSIIFEDTKNNKVC